jgi:hypothetical protein
MLVIGMIYNMVKQGLIPTLVKPFDELLGVLDGSVVYVSCVGVDERGELGRTSSCSRPPMMSSQVSD